MLITLEAVMQCGLFMHWHRVEKVGAKTISEMTGVTLRFSLKILRKLVAAGIVKSFKGTQGGYEIGKTSGRNLAG